MEERKHECPKCHSKLLARKDNKIICTEYHCDWEIESKRAEDKDIWTMAEIRSVFT